MESLKAAMGDVKNEDLKYHVENFVLSVFATTDKEERTCETITKKNAMDFKRTGDFISMLQLFDECYTEEWQERKKYCTYKAGTIMKALKNGEQPERGNPFAPPEEEKKEEEMPAGAQVPQPIAPFGMPGDAPPSNDTARSEMQPQSQDSMFPPVQGAVGYNPAQAPDPMMPSEPMQPPNFMPQQPAYQPQP